MQLGKLEKVSIRSVWKNEAHHFTPWLAGEANINLLGDTINLELEVNSQEERVGLFRADIVCKNLENDSFVLIENQFEFTDHKHLGQLLTYAAGLKTFTVIWIAEHFTEEHRAALDWLNGITDDEVNFFGIEIELYRIGNSEPAPQFKLVSKPNNWSRNVKRSANNADVSDTKLIQLEYWEAFKKIMDKEAAPYKVRDPSPTYFSIITWGSGQRRIRVFANTNKKQIGVVFVIKGQDANEVFANLREKYEADSIKHFGENLEWQFDPGRERQQIILRHFNNDPLKKNEWANQHELLKKSVKMIFEYFMDKN